MHFLGFVAYYFHLAPYYFHLNFAVAVFGRKGYIGYSNMAAELHMGCTDTADHTDTVADKVVGMVADRVVDKSLGTVRMGLHKAVRMAEHMVDYIAKVAPVVEIYSSWL
jgi:hypothetical protein